MTRYLPTANGVDYQICSERRYTIRLTFSSVNGMSTNTKTTDAMSECIRTTACKHLLRRESSKTLNYGLVYWQASLSQRTGTNSKTSAMTSNYRKHQITCSYEHRTFGAIPTYRIMLRYTTVSTFAFGTSPQRW